MACVMCTYLSEWGKNRTSVTLVRIEFEQDRPPKFGFDVFVGGLQLIEFVSEARFYGLSKSAGLGVGKVVHENGSE